MKRLVVPAAVLAVLAPSVARANNCPAQTASVTSLLPSDGATNVPVNGVVAFGTFPAFAPYNPSVTISSGGSAVPGGLVSGPGGTWIFLPDATFAPGTTYDVTIMDVDSANVGSPRTSSFTTGTALDLTDPTPPGAPSLDLVDYVDPVEVNGCSKPGYWDLHVAWAGATAQTPVIYALTVDLVDLQPEFAGTPYKGVITSANEADVSVPQNSEATVYVYAIDEAGRQSHSQPSTIRVPIPPQNRHHNACDVDAAGSAPLEGAVGAIVGAVVALAARRRRRA